MGGKILDSIAAKANTVPVKGVFVGLYGSFFSETDEFQMDDIEDLKKVAREVYRRYKKRTFGFRRCAYLHGEQYFRDPGWIYIDKGTIETQEEVMKRNLPDEQILRDNMRINKVDAVLKINGRHFPFDLKNDVLLEDWKN